MVTNIVVILFYLYDDYLIDNFLIQQSVGSMWAASALVFTLPLTLEYSA